MKRHGLSVLTLLASSSTLFCCAVPALFVLLGAGGVLAGLFSAVPQLTVLSTYKHQLFIVSGVILTIAGVLHARQRYAPCPMDPQAAKACRTTRRVGLVIYAVSLGLYLTGVTFAFILPHLM